jgi:hypothetical protein
MVKAGEYEAQIISGLADSWFWSSSVPSGEPDYAYSFSGYNGYIDYDNQDNEYSVRCVVLH